MNEVMIKRKVKEKYYTIDEIVNEGKLTYKQIYTKVVRYAQAYPLTNLVKKENNSYKVSKAMKDKINENTVTHKSFTINTTYRPADISQLDEVIRTIFSNNPISELTYSLETSSNRLHIHGSILKDEVKDFTKCIKILFSVPYYKDEYYKSGWLSYIAKDGNATYLNK